jgi:hypothetical protein
MTKIYGKECGNCRFSSLQLDEEYWHDCRINPPTAGENNMSIWPTVHKYDWCGKYEVEPS